MTATYYLLAERRMQLHPDRRWNFDEQLHYARALGFQLTREGTIVFDA